MRQESRDFSRSPGWLLLALTMAFTLVFVLPAQTFAAAENTIENATEAFNEAMNNEDERIPRDVLRNARAVAIFPNLTKAALLVGGSYGEGVLMLNQGDEWRGPLFVSIAGLSIGPQLGAEETDLFMVFQNREGLRHLEDGNLKLGAKASVAAGAWGGKAGVETDADVLTYKQTEGLFAGVSLAGAEIELNEAANEKYFEESGKMRAYYGAKKALSGDKPIPQTTEVEALIILLGDYQ